MIFFNTEYLYFFFGVPVVLFFLLLRLRRKKKLLLRIYSMQYIRRFKIFHANVGKTVLLSLFAFLLCLYFLDPHIQLQGKQQEQEAKSSVLHVFLDVSQSMYAKDTKKTRIAHAVDLLERSLKDDKNMNVTLSVFTDTVVQLVPYSSDRVFLQNALEEVKRRPLITGSSDLLAVFTQLMQENSRYHRADQEASIVILSDWEMHRSHNPSLFSRLSLLYSNMHFVVLGTGLETIVFDAQGRVLNDGNGRSVFSRANKELAQDYAQRLGAHLLVYEEQKNNQIIDIHTQRQIYISLAWMISIALAGLLLVYIILER